MKTKRFTILLSLLLISSFALAASQSGQTGSITPVSLGGLYAGGTNPGYVYQYVGGTTWNVISPNLGWSVTSLVEYNGKLHAGVMTQKRTQNPNGQVWRYEGIDSGTHVWTKIGDNMGGDTSMKYVNLLVVYNGDLYAGTSWGRARLYKYISDMNWNMVVDHKTPGHVTSSGTDLGWHGFRAAHVWDNNNLMYLGDHAYDLFGKFDGTTFTHLADKGGSCVWDIEEYQNNLYGSAWIGRLYKSTDGTAWNQVIGPDPNSRSMWELEVYQNYLWYGMDWVSGGTQEGQLWKYDGTTKTKVWSTPVSYSHEGVISMATDNSYLYIGMGAEFSYYTPTGGTGKVYKYDGTNVTSISGTMGWGVQILLYIEPTNQYPSVDFTWSPPIPQEGQNVSFTSNASDPDGNITSYSWNFGDGGTSNAQNPTHTYGHGGVYTVTLTVTDDGGLSASVSKNITITNVPPTVVMTATPNPVDEGSNVTFDGYFDDPSWLDMHIAVWDFGDGTIVPGTFSPGVGFTHHEMNAVTHAYGHYGIYTATLTVTDDMGGVGFAYVNVTVLNVPPTVVMTAAPNPVDEGSPVTFDGYFDDPSWLDTHTALWEFGDSTSAPGTFSPGVGFTHHEMNAIDHTYCDNGVYPATLTVTDDAGDSGQDSVNVTVNNVAPTVNAGSDKVGNEPTTFAFTGSGGGTSGLQWTLTATAIRPMIPTQ
jgi:PKD repeat protein